MGVGSLSEAFDIQHGKSWIRHCLSEDALGVRLESRFQLSRGAVRLHEGALDPHALEGMGKQVVGAPVYGRGGYHVIPGAGQVEHGEEIGRLPA